jgi:hypothetical protein
VQLRFLAFTADHRYLGDEVCSRHNSSQKSTSTRAIVVGTTKAAGRQGRRAGSTDMPDRGAQKLTGENLKPVWAEFSILS